MSGIYIKGMDMPTRCEDCFCYRYNAEYDHAYCNISAVNVLHGNARLNGCPLVPVPDHGRLIDADAFIKDECNNCDGACEALPCDCLNCKSDCRCEFIVDLADAPTIIPADPDKEGEE